MLGIDLGPVRAAGRMASAPETVLDFATGAYVAAGVVQPDLASALTVSGGSFSRSGAGTARQADGSLAAFASGSARVTGRGLLIEAASTNLAPWSWTPSNAGWSVGAGTKTPGQADPLGGTGAALFTADGTNAQHYLFMPSATMTAGTTYVVSVLLKAGSTSRVQLLLPSPRFAVTPYVNLLLSGTGSVTASGGSPASAGVEAVAGGWVRAWLAGVCTSSGASPVGGLFPLATGAEGIAQVSTSTGSFLAVGAQSEAGSQPSSAIVTSGSGATRGGDEISVGLADGQQTITVDWGEAERTVIARSSLADPGLFAFGASSGRPWVGSYVRRVRLG